MKFLLSLCSLLFLCQSSLAQLRIDNYTNSKQATPLSMEEINPKTQKNYNKEYANAFSSSLSIGISNFHGDLIGNQTDIEHQLNVNLEINKRLSPWFSWKLLMSAGKYQAIGVNKYQSLYTSGINTNFTTTDFYNSLLEGGYSTLSALFRTRIAFSKLNSIKAEKKFGLFFNFGLGYMNSNVLLKNRTDHNIKISRSIKDMVIPIIIESNLLLSDRLGFTLSYDYYILSSEYMDLLINNKSSDYLSNIRAGLFLKINN